MAYTEQTWTDGSAGGTPIDAARLTHIEDGIYNAAATADAAIPSSQKGAANGVASLDSTGKVPSAQLPAGSGGSSVVDWVSVTAHGAVGDDTTDDTSAIQAAINATPVGGTCYFPRPSVAYKITALLTVPHAMRLLGGGAFIGQYTKIRQATANTDAFNNTAAAWVIEGLEIAGAGTTAGRGIYSTTGTVVRRCYIHAFYDNLVVYSTNTSGTAFYTTVEESFFDSAAHAGVRLQGIPNNFTWRDCRANSNAIGVLVDGGPLSFRMFGGAVEANTSLGVEIDGHDATAPQDTNAVLLSGVYFEGNGTGTTDLRLGISATVYGARVESCAFIVGSSGNPTLHINAPNVNGLTITDCTFWGTGCVNVGSSSTGVVYASNYNKNSGTVTLPASAIILSSLMADPTTTKGDLIVHGTSTTRLAVGADTYVLTADSTQATGVKWAAPSGGGGGSITVQDEGTALTSRSIIDFVGAGVTATDDAANSRTVVTIPGGGGSSAPLASVNYDPATLTVVSTTSTTFAAMDTTNLVVSFTPSSSAVWVTICSFMDLAWATGADIRYVWGLLASGSAVTGSIAAMLRATTRTTEGQRMTYRTKIAVTSGTAVTWQLAHRIDVSGGSAQAGRSIYGGGWGPITIEVEAA